ncbi:T6SS phospholipase effector Tle1-like catalytic domain-containing protein [Massilia antarctica]|uniref:T6SS phospholipase effector Tle1-like catalytic domain-containing protein n=1 Tax=Massilia antarctica TaxID=2765360 RepID=UPI0006BB566F|nr:DUF2235 domain-containing protein [Massilia sp. H27-R4]MCY0912616.1 DUF2235 domain-containing protein [Massilia sp. H27-R4]CUI03678.1 FIG00458238: hypothetical protein [Janthinobacterium sp. CG23_2]CUU27464.1 FIG00458238: hypothetical protein [Janthinobacterium sp. CG23_2]
MSKPTIRRLSDITKNEKFARNIYRTELDKVAIATDLTACRKPVWISCFFDGTGNNYKEDGNGAMGASKQKYSNIAKLGKFAHTEKDVKNRTYAIYAQGVGTPFLEIGDSGGGLDKATGMASAAKGQKRIDWMLNKLKARIDAHMPHVNQINVAVFGFSRGAAQARAFVRQLAEQCYHQADDQLIWTKSGGYIAPKLVIYFLGIFDTVASTGYGGSRLESALPYVLTPITVLGPAFGGVLHAIDDGGHAEWANDLRIPSYVRFCEHYVAAHEVREKFPSDSIRVNQATDANCRETMYPGAHSDVGGGYDDMNQEGRANELSRIPLCNMYLSAYAAGVPFNPPEQVLEEAGGLFEITGELERCFNAYMKHISADNRLETQVISHMNAYYHWRWGRTERQRAARKEREAMIAKGQTIMYATPDKYMTITDAEWEKDVQNIAEKRTGLFRSSTEPVEDAIYEAWKGKLRKSMPVAERKSFDDFFDRYVHDSVAGFKNQMTDSHIGFIEFSRWTRNRQYFMGKRGKKFLYWRYEGAKPESSGVREAMSTPKEGSADGQSAVA